MSLQILAPMPGTFYRRPSPDAASYKEVGDEVRVGDEVGLIEVMKSFIPVESEVEGRVVRFAVEDGDPVSPGDVLVELE